MPTIAGGKGAATDIAAWNGGGYAVSSKSEVKEEAIKFLNYMYQPDKLSKYGWENGVGMSAQDQTSYMSGKETKLQMQFVEAVNGASRVSGTPVNDCGPSAFKTSIESEIQSVSNGTITVDEFLSKIGEACKSRTEKKCKLITAAGEQTGGRNFQKGEVYEKIIQQQTGHPEPCPSGPAAVRVCDSGPHLPQCLLRIYRLLRNGFLQLYRTGELSQTDEGSGFLDLPQEFAPLSHRLYLHSAPAGTDCGGSAG